MYIRVKSGDSEIEYNSEVVPSSRCEPACCPEGYAGGISAETLYRTIRVIAEQVSKLKEI